MNSRNYDNMPPIANNTVTISTSGPQVRLSTGMRPIAVPLRPQPVPIRKMVHDGGGGGSMASTSSSTMQPIQFATMHHQVKEEEPHDYQTASTSSGPLIATGPSSNSFQQYQRGSVLNMSGAVPSSSSNVMTSSSTVPSTSGSGALVANNNGGGANPNSMAMDQPAPVNLASKVAEVFLTAGHAFQKLGDLTLQLHTTTETDESKWSDREVDNLKNALTRFAHELDQISSCVANRTTKHIKNDIKRRHLLADESQQQQLPVKRIALSAGPSGSGGPQGYTAMRSDLIGTAVPLTQKRVMQPMTKMMTTRAMAPTRYTVAPMSGSSALLPNSAVVVSGSSSGHGGSPSPAGMPQLHSQGGSSASGAAMSQQRLHGGPSTSSSLSSGVLIPSTSTMTTRVMAPQHMKLVVPAAKHTMTTRGMAPSSGALTMQPVSGALILEHND